MKKKRIYPPRHLYALFDVKGEFCDIHFSRREAELNAWGPRFRPEPTIRQYRLVLRKDETDE